MVRIKKGIIVSIILILIVAASSCTLYDLIFPSADDSSDKDNYCDFTITRGSVESDYNWKSSSDLGFLKTSGYYFKIFEGENSNDDGGFHNYLFINIADNSTGVYHSSDGVTHISYYDITGDLYMVYGSDSENYIDITLDTWDSESVTGRFSGTLRNSSGNYVGITGSFISFDSVSRGLNRREWEMNQKNIENIKQ